MKKKMILIPVIICAALVLICVGVPRSQAFAKWQLSKIEHADAALDFEEGKRDDVLAFKEHHDGYETTAEKNNLILFKDPEKAGAQFLPEGVQCGEVGMSPDFIYFDYFSDNIRYTVQYNTDGSIEKTFRPNNQKKIFEISTKSDKINYMHWR